MREPNETTKRNRTTSEIIITKRNGKEVRHYISPKDVKKVSKYHWHEHSGYAERIDAKTGRRIPITWHLLGKPEKGYVIHHRNGNKRDNRRKNLMKITWSHHIILEKTRANKSTGRRGVSKYKTGKFCATVGVGGKRKLFDTFEEALQARRKFERDMFYAMGLSPDNYFAVNSWASS